ncbi:MAG: class I SAM-dependent methyltransferase [Anaerolineales bacterium]|nr:MAG: class I SAM-dependent methyltransferase [Anaerolineales bacterium]
MSEVPPTTPVCDYENSNYRTDFWEGQGREYEDLAERIALHRLLPVSGRRIIDIGAGFGRLADLYDGYDHVILLDYSLSQLEYARQRLGTDRITYVAADIYRLPLRDNVVDTAVMVRVMHHLANVPSALRQLQRILQPGGALVLEYANKRHLKNILRRALGRGPNPFDEQPYEFAPLHFDFHPRWIKQRLISAGFTPQRQLSVSLLRSAFLKRRIKSATLAMIDGWQQGIFAPISIAPSMFVRTATLKVGDATMPALDDLFCCPDCGSDLMSVSSQAQRCSQCGRDWPIINGIHVFK